MFSTETAIGDTFLSYKTNRNINQVETALEALRLEAISNSKVLPGIKVCILAGATVGEICAQLSAVWGKN